MHIILLVDAQAAFGLSIMDAWTFVSGAKTESKGVKTGILSGGLAHDPVF